MNQKQPTEEQEKELSWEEAVSRYLEDHPDYFRRYPSALAKLSLSHEVGSGAVSLIERQVKVLREDNQSLSRQLRELVAIARENEVLSSRLHRFALAMADSASLDELFDSAYEMLRREFKIEAVAILCAREPGTSGRNEFVGQDAKLKGVLRQFNAGKPICGGKLEESMMKYLFGRHAAETKSTALISLGNKTPQGVLALGSHDTRRFHPGMGTVYLVKLGEILMHSISRFR